MNEMLTYTCSCLLPPRAEYVGMKEQANVNELPTHTCSCLPPPRAEYVGTKTSVQIRSHAQKHFAKVERGDAGTEAIPIPPPRYKRKSAKPKVEPQPQAQQLQQQQQQQAMQLMSLPGLDQTSKFSSGSAFQSVAAQGDINTQLQVGCWLMIVWLPLWQHCGRGVSARENMLCSSPCCGCLVD